MDQKFFNRWFKNTTYKNDLGGGAPEWECRGKFQLYLLQKLGLQSNHSFLDIGCGPIRGGEHFIKFLNKNKYTGIDRNDNYIKISKHIVENSKELKDKDPVLKISDFLEIKNKLEEDARYDIMFAFAVFKKVYPRSIFNLIDNLEPNLNVNGKIIFSHLRMCRKVEFNLTKKIKSNFKLHFLQTPEELVSHFKGDFTPISLWPVEWQQENKPGFFPVMILEKML